MCRWVRASCSTVQSLSMSREDRERQAGRQERQERQAGQQERQERQAGPQERAEPDTIVAKLLAKLSPRVLDRGGDSSEGLPLFQRLLSGGSRPHTPRVGLFSRPPA